MNKEVKNESFVFYVSFLETIERMEENGKYESANNLIRAIIDRGIYGEFESDDPEVFEHMPTIDKNIAAATKRYKSASNGGSKGGRKASYDKELIIELKK